MKIALLAPFEESVPPKRYGGTETVVANLADELVGMGHDVTLFASGDSQTKAKLVACTPRSVRTSKEAYDPVLRSFTNMQGLIHAIAEISKGKFNIVHNHHGWHTLQFSNLIKTPIVTTIHGSLNEPAEKRLFSHFRDSSFVSISNSQRQPSPRMNFVATVYNGIRVEDFKFNAHPKDYLAFLGRVHPQKGLDRAIKIANKVGKQLIIGAKTDPADVDYFKSKIRPLLKNKGVTFLGEVTHKQRVSLLANASAILSPIQWDEPFGMVNIEAMACGTHCLKVNQGWT